MLKWYYQPQEWLSKGERVMNNQRRIEELKLHIERAYNIGLSKNHPQVKRWYREYYELTERQ